MPSPIRSVRPDKLKDLVSQTWIDVRIVRDLPPSEVDRAEALWKPVRQKLAMSRRATGREPEHAHWNWNGKSNPFWASQWRFVAVLREERFEGLMAIRTKPKAGRLSTNPVLYVDFVEVAPWNSRDLTDAPQLSGVGTLLITEALAMSVEMGWNGRVGLSALPQAKGFYSRLGMMLVDEGDPEYGDLAYFEFDEVASRKFLTETL